MTPRTLAITDLLQAYLHQVGFREREIQRRLRQETLRLQGASMLLAPEQGAFMALLADFCELNATSRSEPLPGTAPLLWRSA
jgi:hypothetical protein